MSQPAPEGTAEVATGVARQMVGDSDPAQHGRALRRAIALKNYEFDRHGVEMNRRYASGAVLTDGQPEPAFERGREQPPLGRERGLRLRAGRAAP